MLDTEEAGASMESDNDDDDSTSLKFANENDDDEAFCNAMPYPKRDEPPKSPPSTRRKTCARGGVSKSIKY